MGLGSEITLAELEVDPDPILARMRATEPVCWVDSMDMWLVTRWEDVAHMEARPELFSAATDPSFLARALGPNMLVMDPPAHTRVRDMMLPPFQSGGRSGDFVAGELAELADGILDGIAGPTIELMGSYAQPLAAGALAIVLGLDGHGFDRMWSWCEGLVTDIANFENDPAATAIGETAKEDLGEAIGERIGRAAGSDSAIDWFVRAGATPAEIVNNVRLMISGGINEPRDGVGLVAWVLLTRPDLRRAVASDGRRLRRLVEEVFRVHSPVGTITRQATRDLELAGAAIAAGDLVSGVLRSINLDEEHWSDPTEIDLGRREGPHAAFALGVHRCLGEWLGRQEVRIGIERLLARFPDIALDAARPVELHGFEFRGPREVWVTV
ncbi:MAG: cytochrome P450 [bacterium]|nr:cytochrome P450 [bacterium]